MRAVARHTLSSSLESRPHFSIDLHTQTQKKIRKSHRTKPNNIANNVINLTLYGSCYFYSVETASHHRKGGIHISVSHCFQRAAHALTYSLAHIYISSLSNENISLYKHIFFSLLFFGLPFTIRISNSVRHFRWLFGSLFVLSNFRRNEREKQKKSAC